jgi:hypothetical protein
VGVQQVEPLLFLWRRAREGKVSLASAGAAPAFGGKETPQISARELTSPRQRGYSRNDLGISGFPPLAFGEGRGPTTILDSAVIPRLPFAPDNYSFGKTDGKYNYHVDMGNI